MAWQRTRDRYSSFESQLTGSEEVGGLALTDYIIVTRVPINHHPHPRRLLYKYEACVCRESIESPETDSFPLSGGLKDR